MFSPITIVRMSDVALQSHYTELKRLERLLAFSETDVASRYFMEKINTINDKISNLEVLSSPGQEKK